METIVREFLSTTGFAHMAPGNAIMIVIGMVFVALVTIHCMHTLVIAAQKLVREK